MEHTVSVLRKLDDMAPTRILQGCKSYEETVRTAPPRDLLCIPLIPLWMQPSTAYPCLPTVKIRLRCGMVPHNHRPIIILSLEDVHDTRKVACL